VSTVVRRLRHARPVRAIGLPTYRFLARMHGGAPPRVLANSLPKAGTHLLTGLLDQLPDMRYSGEHITAFDVHGSGGYDWRRLRSRLDRVRQGQYVSAHLPAEPEAVELVAALGYRCVCIIRDPRDVVVSDMHYILRFDRHPLHRSLQDIETMDARLTAMITGLPGSRSGLPTMPSLARRLEDYQAWLTAKSTIVVRFENLVGPTGGGGGARQLAEVGAVARHVDRDMTPERLREAADRVWSTRSSTFRRGAIGDWRRHFTPAQEELVKETAGELLATFGYR
jgi:Sulfotransferase domain